MERDIRWLSKNAFLNMTSDRSLAWLPHLRDLKVAYARRFILHHVISIFSLGADRVVVLRLHQILIISKLNYGCQLYFSLTVPCLQSLYSIHQDGGRLTTDAFQICPFLILVDAGVLPLDSLTVSGCPLHSNWRYLARRFHRSCLFCPSHNYVHTLPLFQ